MLTNYFRRLTEPNKSFPNGCHATLPKIRYINVLNIIMKLYMIHCPSSSQDKIVERVSFAALLQLPPRDELLAHFSREREGETQTRLYYNIPPISWPINFNSTATAAIDQRNRSIAARTSWSSHPTLEFNRRATQA